MLGRRVILEITVVIDPIRPSRRSDWAGHRPRSKETRRALACHRPGRVGAGVCSGTRGSVPIGGEPVSGCRPASGALELGEDEDLLGNG